MGVMTTECTGVDMADEGKDKTVVTVFVEGQIVGTFTLEENEVKPLNYISYTHTFFLSSHPYSRTKRKAQLRRKNNGNK